MPVAWQAKTGSKYAQFQSYSLDYGCRLLVIRNQLGRFVKKIWAHPNDQRTTINEQPSFAKATAGKQPTQFFAAASPIRQAPL